MIRLLIIADDFTGALDTGVQFARAGISTYVTAEHEINFESLPDEEQVLVADTESRHIPHKDAADRVKRIADAALRHGVPYFYKKTDSTLRGNIGAEIGALMDAAGGPVVFVPAYPKAGRTTVNGRQFVLGVPLEQSAFAKDPLDPMTTSDIAEILHFQTDRKVKSVKPGQHESFDEPDAIYIVDGENEEDLAVAGQRLQQQNKLRVTAGCAGFAAHLAELLPLEHRKMEVDGLPQNILLICGSVNEKSMKQLEAADRLGFEKVLPPSGYLKDASLWDKPEGEMVLQKWAERLDANGRLIVISTSADGARMPAELSCKIAKSMGRLTRGILERSKPCVLVVFGGDTAIGIMNDLGCHGILPKDEVEPGVPISAMQSRFGKIHVVSKAGGLGSDAVLNNIIDYCGRKEI